MTVPSRPTNGAVAADGREARNALLQVVRGQRGGASYRVANRIEQVFTPEVGAAFLLELVFLQAREHDLRQVAVAYGLRQRDRFLQAAFLEVLGHQRCIHLRLLGRLVERVDALNRNTHRPCSTMKRMMATDDAAVPICSNMSTRSRPPPSCANAGTLISNIANAALAIRPN